MYIYTYLYTRCARGTSGPPEKRKQQVVLKVTESEVAALGVITILVGVLSAAAAIGKLPHTILPLVS